MRTNVSTKRSGRRVVIVVREHRDGRVVKTRRKAIRPTAGERNRLRLVMRSPRARPRYTVRMVTRPLGPGDGYLLSRVRWVHHELDQPASDPDSTRQQLSNGCAYSSRGIPACGAYLGQTYGANQDPAEFERNLGRRLGVHRLFYRADQVASAVTMARQDLASGRLPWVSFKLPHSWGAMAAGQGDAWARDLAQRFAQLDGPVWLAFHHEPEYDGDIVEWRQMQERLGPIVRSGGTNLGFSVIVTGYHQFYGEEQFHLDNMWPRGIKVDVAGFDIYNQYGVVKDGEENTTGTDLDAWYFSKIRPWAEKEGVAWGLGETGYTDKAAERDPGWIRRTHRELEAAGGVAFAYFNTTLNSIAPWTLDTPAKIEAWRQAQVGTPLLPRP